jgi:omega-amidase
MKIAALQMDIAWEDRQSNYDKVEKYASQAADQGADLLVLPEMFSTGFSMNPGVTAEDPDGPTACFIRELAQKRKIGVVGGLVLKAANGRGKNCALAVDRNGEDLALYSKCHLFSFLEEEKHHEAGDGPVVFEFENMKMACFICYDLRFAGLFAMVAKECQLTMVVASWPSARQLHWDTLLPARAVENQQYIVGVNRVGSGGGLEFTGGTVIVDPGGEILVHAKDKEKLILADATVEKIEELRKQMPFLKDRRF